MCRLPAPAERAVSESVSRSLLKCAKLGRSIHALHHSTYQASYGVRSAVFTSSSVLASLDRSDSGYEEGRPDPHPRSLRG